MNTKLALTEVSAFLYNEITRQKTSIVVDGLEAIASHNLLILSRQASGVEVAFNELKSLEKMASDTDIGSYVKDRIDTEKGLKRMVQKASGLEQTVINAVVQKAHGM
ncbi:hypothetical protein K432DRAFT_404536 [Lepidopterella palustris CBS 459.81]|uniref:Uncharacterized protein n=1 Tax=Lepidopterella palustris CBS 459.81 TaxID=1314670 RepID=A0A8E2EAU9_9PEZI|nr:hypothetical protein K432DRAFT_404536 [Lepidopterella palustris CBS 459.81]